VFALVKAELHRLLTEERGFKYYERIPRFALLAREFAVGEELTQTMKLRRNVIAEPRRADRRIVPPTAVQQHGRRMRRRDFGRLRLAPGDEGTRSFFSGLPDVLPVAAPRSRSGAPPEHLA
jgi:hypothetical protein